MSSKTSLALASSVIIIPLLLRMAICCSIVVALSAMVQNYEFSTRPAIGNRNTTYIYVFGGERMGMKAVMAAGGANQAGDSEFDEHRLLCRWVAARLQFSR